MQITVEFRADRYELQLQGRLDANWADHLGKALESAIRQGHHELELDFAQVGYISSAGIRVLLKYYRQLKAARGGLRIVRPTDPVLSVLRLSGLEGILLTPAPQRGASEPGQPAEAAGSEPVLRPWRRGGVEYESYGLCPVSPMRGQMLGSPDALARGQLSAAQSYTVRCTPDVLAVGIGAFGVRPEDTESRFGEAMAAGGVALTLPTDGSSVPDYQTTEGELVPELHLLYGLTARGDYSRLIRFEAGRSQRGVVGLSELVQAVLEKIESASAGFAILAESGSVVGAMLKRSPALASGQSVLSFPLVRDWLTFTTERADERNLVLISGVAQLRPESGVAAGLRPIGPGTEAHGHFHAAVFPFRPLPKGRLELHETVASVLGSESAQGVMHLLADEREFEGVGETDLMRGACWVSPLDFVGRTAPKDSSL